MTAEAGQSDFDQGVEDDPVLFVVDDGPDGPDELLRLVTAEAEPASAESTVDDGTENAAREDETSGASGGLPR